jgi:hypothetical protein
MAERPDAKVYAALTEGSPSEIDAAVGGRIYRTESRPDFTLDSNIVSWQSVLYDVWCVANDHATAESMADLVEAMDADGIRSVNRIAEKGDTEGSPFAAIVTLEVTVT